MFTGLETSAVQLSGTSTFPSRASNLSFSLAQRAREQAGRQPTKSLREQTKTCPGQAKFESHLSIVV